VDISLGITITTNYFVTVFCIYGADSRFFKKIPPEKKMNFSWRLSAFSWKTLKESFLN